MTRVLKDATIAIGVMFLLIGCWATGADTPEANNSAGTLITWPLRLDSSSGTITVYQPQPEKFDGATLTARAAVSLEPPNQPNAEPEFGSIWLTAKVATDRDARTVTIQDIDVRRVKLPNGTEDQEKQFEQVLEAQIPSLNITFSLDELMTSLSVAEQEKAQAAQLQTTPPKIIFTNSPSVLVTIDGQPKLEQLDTFGVMRVVNTPFIILLDMAGKRYYLKAGDNWMSATDPAGPWSNVASIPGDVQAAAGKIAEPNAPTAGGPPPQIIVAQEPTELIVSDGAPTYSPIPGGELLYMSNTDSDVFMEVTSQKYFVLLSGRWYQAASMQGPWNYVASDKLPAAFATIPPDSEKGHVLASVAGTTEAVEARLDARVPQTAAIRRDSGADLAVTYDGDPQFVPVEGSACSYASNCADPVLLVRNNYYCCHQGVWYQANLALGPWSLCISVPSDIYALPPSCPVYNVRYVYVYDVTPDYVYCGYLPGYTGCFVFGPTVVFGTGFVYPGWYHHTYIPRPRTWGFAPRYDWRSASWGFEAGHRLNESWFARGEHVHNWWGPGGFVDYKQLNERRAVAVAQNHAVNDRRAEVSRINLYNRNENTRRNITVVPRPQQRQSQGTHVEATARPAAENNVYAGHDGTVYRRTNNGWEQRDKSGWKAMDGVPEGHPQVPAPAHEPQEKPQQHNQAPQPVEQPQRVQPPAHVDHPVESSPQRPVESTPRAPVHEEPAREPQREPSGGNSGLENDHAARERGDARRGDQGPPSSPPRNSAPAGRDEPRQQPQQQQQQHR